MDENTWRFAQLMMWLIGIQTTVIMGAFGGMWIAISKRLESMEKRMDKMEERLTDIDKRVFAIETMLHMKDCCLLKNDQHLKNAE